MKKKARRHCTHSICPKYTLPECINALQAYSSKIISGPLAIIYSDDSPAYSPIPMYINVMAYFK
jgi:hypothetical protein